MPASLTKGTTYVNGGTVNSSNLHALVENMTIAGIDRDNINRVLLTPIHYNATAPSSPVNGELWIHPTTQIIVAWDEANMRWQPTTANCRSYFLEATSTDAAAGSVLASTATSGEYSVPSGASARNVVGVSAIPTAAGEYGVAVNFGVTQVLTTGSVGAGDALVTSSTAGVATSKAFGTGYGVEVFARTLRAASGGSAWINLKF